MTTSFRFFVYKNYNAKIVDDWEASILETNVLTDYNFNNQIFHWSNYKNYNIKLITSLEIDVL